MAQRGGATGDPKSDDYYKVLGVTRGATEAEIAKGTAQGHRPPEKRGTPS